MTGTVGHRLTGPLAAALLGVLAFMTAIGGAPLDPGNIAWLGRGDPTTHYLGWQFFRSAPWAWPPGANPAYGLELGSSIVYSDSIPALALPFKLADGLLPDTFQYFGLWLLACFVLQAVFGWKLAALASEHAAVRLLGAGLITFAPPFFWRASGQSSLASHWLVLAALYLTLRPGAGGRLLHWTLLAGAAVLVHAYLLAMVLALWLADFAARPERRPLREPATLLATVSLTAWLCGYFVLPPDGVVREPYGMSHLNLLSPIDPNNWSHVVPDLPGEWRDYDGFNFLGLGVLLLAGAVAVSRWRELRGLLRGRREVLPRHRRPLAAVLLALACFAVSHKIFLGTLGPLVIPLPEAVLNALSVFHASGRFFWPVYYALVYWIIWLAGRSPQPRASLAMLCAAFAVQVADMSKGWLPMRAARQAAPASEWPSPLRSPFWQAAAQKYSKVRWVPANNMTPHWLALSSYAAKHGLATDAVYLARMSFDRVAASRSGTVAALRSGELERDSLYVLDPSYVARLSWKLRPGDLLAEVDGLLVLAPAWDAGRIPAASE